MSPGGQLLRGLGRRLATAVGWLRAVAGDDAYERYLTHHARTGAGPVLDRRRFYEDRERRKWGGISRCC